MSKDLVTLKLNVPAVADDVLSQVEEVSKGADFIPRLQLIGKGKYVDTNKIGPGRWGVPQAGGEEVTDLGESIDVIPLAARPKAMDVSDTEAIITVYDTQNPEFKRIIEAPKNSGCMWGPTYLVYERSSKSFYELFFGNASGRAEAGKLRPFLPKDGQVSAATLNIRYKPSKTFGGWHVPVIVKCTMPFKDLPPIEEINATIEKFMSIEPSVEKAPEQTPQQAQRAR